MAGASDATPIDSGCDSEVMVERPPSQQTGDQEEEDTWACPACTFGNDILHAKCAQCDVTKPKNTDWSCPRCTFANQADYLQCASCAYVESEHTGWVCSRCQFVYSKDDLRCVPCNVRRPRANRSDVVEKPVSAITLRHDATTHGVPYVVGFTAPKTGRIGTGYKKAGRARDFVCRARVLKQQTSNCVVATETIAPGDVVVEMEHAQCCTAKQKRENFNGQAAQLQDPRLTYVYDANHTPNHVPVWHSITSSDTPNLERVFVPESDTHMRLVYLAISRIAEGEQLTTCHVPDPAAPLCDASPDDPEIQWGGISLQLPQPASGARPKRPVQSPQDASTNKRRHADMFTKLLFGCGDVERHPGPQCGAKRHATMMLELLYACGDVERLPGPWSDLFLHTAPLKRERPEVADPRPAQFKIKKQRSAPGVNPGQPSSSFSNLFLSSSKSAPKQVEHSAHAAFEQLYAPIAPASVAHLVRKPTPGQVQHHQSGMPSAYLPGVLPATEISTMAANDMADTLLRDDSEFALRPSDPALFRKQVQHVMTFVHHGVKPGTRAQDKNGWKYHVAYCAMHNTPVLRTNKAMIENPQREAWREAATMIFASTLMRPRCNHKVDVLPRSAMNIVLSIRRVMGYSSVTCGKWKFTRMVLNGMNQAHMLIHGKDSLRPVRKEALPDAAYERMFTIKQGTALGSMRASETCHDFVTLLDTISLLDDTGLRKAEVIAQPKEVFIQCMDWLDVGWYLDSTGTVEEYPTEAQFNTMNKRCYLVVTPTNSKCDATGEQWGTHPMAIPFENIPSNAAYRLRARYRKLRISELSRAERRRLPLFADEHGRAYSASALDKRYTALLQHVLPKSASLYSMHSHRIRLACRLRRVNASDARIQAMCRWMSPESLHIYARWDIHKYAKWVQRSRKANATTLETTNMPMIGETLSGTVAALSEHAERARTHKPAPGPLLPHEVFSDSAAAKPKAPASSRPVRFLAAKIPSLHALGFAVTEEHLGSCARCLAVPPRPKQLLPTGTQAIRHHAKARCFWSYVHPRAGTFASLSQLRQALQPVPAMSSVLQATPTDYASPPLKSPPLCIKLNDRKKRKRARRLAKASSALPTVFDSTGALQKASKPPRPILPKPSKRRPPPSPSDTSGSVCRPPLAVHDVLLPSGTTCEDEVPPETAAAEATLHCNDQARREQRRARRARQRPSPMQRSGSSLNHPRLMNELHCGLGT